MEHGRVVEQGPTKDVLERPRSSFGAGIAGLNLARGHVDGRAVRTPGGLVVAGLHGDQDVPDGVAAVAVFSPGAVSVHRERPTGSPRNVWTTTIRELEPRGSQVRVQTDEMSADVTAPVVAELDLMPGTEIFLAIKASEVAIYEA
jgi:molybdate transport system ATP-binding protein